MTLSAIERISGACAPMVRFGGSHPNARSALHVAPSRRSTWERTVTGPAVHARRQVRPLPPSVAKATVCPLLVSLGGGSFFSVAPAVWTSGPPSVSALAGFGVGAVGNTDVKESA